MSAANYVYVLVRADIPLEQQAVQACHASLHVGYAEDEPSSPPNLVLLTVPSESRLLAVANDLDKQGLRYSLFNEPDGGMGFSALATRVIQSAKERRLFSAYPLFRSPPQLA